MTVGSLFSGIGGLDLGFEWAGFDTKWFCEIEDYPCKVLDKHWPDVPIINDIRDVTAKTVSRVDCIIGGFPCQDISYAGKGRGISYNLSEQEGTRSGLWWEMWRVVRELRPRYMVAENVSTLTNRGLDIVLGSLAEIGYDAEWQIVSAAAVGAPHIRERVFIVAYPAIGWENVNTRSEQPGRTESGEDGVRSQVLADSERNEPERGGRSGELAGTTCEDKGAGEERERLRDASRSGGEVMAHADRQGPQGRSEVRGGGRQRPIGASGSQPDWFRGSEGQPWPVSFRNAPGPDSGRLEGATQKGWNGSDVERKDGPRKRRLEVEYDFCGVAYGVSDRVGILKAYGNAVVPQVAYLVARAVREHAEENGWWR